MIVTYEWFSPPKKLISFSIVYDLNNSRYLTCCLTEEIGRLKAVCCNGKFLSPCNNVGGGVLGIVWYWKPAEFWFSCDDENGRGDISNISEWRVVWKFLIKKTISINYFNISMTIKLELKVKIVFYKRVIITNSSCK